jgi:hypothetical protein
LEQVERSRACGNDPSDTGGVSSSAKLHRKRDAEILKKIDYHKSTELEHEQKMKHF